MKIITTDNGVSLVEYVGPDGLTRVVVPAGAEYDGEALQAGIPWGLDWDSLRLPSLDSQAVAREFRRSGLWTAADVHNHPAAARAAVLRALAPLVGAVFTWIEKEGSHER